MIQRTLSSHNQKQPMAPKNLSVFIDGADGNFKNRTSFQERS